MTFHETFLMTSDELQIVAAASGIKHFLTFLTEGTQHRPLQAQTVLRLINEGFFVRNNTTLAPGKPSRPFLQILREAAFAVVVTAANRETAPVCIYSDAEKKKCIQIIPYEHRVNTFEISIFDPELLLRNLEQMNLLPASESGIFPQDEGKQQVPSEVICIDKQRDKKEIYRSMQSGVLSSFDRYDLAAQKIVSNMMIAQSDFTWRMAFKTSDDIQISEYSRSRAAVWLWEGQV